MRPSGRAIAEMFSSMTEADRIAPRWPDGCRKPQTCARARACSYMRCQHLNRDIGAEIDLAEATAPALPAVVTGTYVDGLLAAADALDVPQSEILLAGGEMTSAEIRSVKAILAWKKREILEMAQRVSGAC